MKFSIGYQMTEDQNFVDTILKYRDRIYEVYFSFGDTPNGRHSQTSIEGLLPHEITARQLQELSRISAAGIPLNLLYNGNCYGEGALSRTFFNSIGDTVDYFSREFTLASVTTTSPLIARFIKGNFENIKTRASVNMEIGTVEGMEYLSKYFDSYYMKREYNRDFDKIRELREWCDESGKELFMLANSGCLNNCSAHNFHDNLVAHESEISRMDNAYNFGGICHAFLSDEKNYAKLIEYTNFVRPEDMHKYDGLFCAAKLATRVHRTPAMVLDSYVRGSYSGDVLRLLEPSHSIYPYVIENGEPMKLKKTLIQILTVLQ